MKRLVALSFLIAIACNSTHNRNNVSPEQAAGKWLKALGLNPIGVACAQTDTDNDGYVSCEVNYGDRHEQIQCAAYGAFIMDQGCNERPVGGCKTAKQNVIVQDRRPQ